MFESEGFELDYFKEKNTTEFKNAMRNWDIPADIDMKSFKKYENKIKNKLMILDSVSAVWIDKEGITYSMYCKPGRFVTFL